MHTEMRMGKALQQFGAKAMQGMGPTVPKLVVLVVLRVLSLQIHWQGLVQVI